MTKNKFSLSVVVPLFNEQNRVNNLPEIINSFKKYSPNPEIIVVNDGSTDKTLNKIKKFQKLYKLKLISYPQNMGKGYALKQGILASGGEYVIFLDVDLSTHPDQFKKFLPHLKSSQILIGTRKSKGASLTYRQPKIRESLGKGFTWLSNKTLNLNISDLTCGFKCFPTPIAKKVFRIQKINRWGFDAEILFLVTQMGYQIKEIPIVWKNDPNTKVRFPQDIFRSARDLILVKFYKFWGEYNQ